MLRLSKAPQFVSYTSFRLLPEPAAASSAAAPVPALLPDCGVWSSLLLPEPPFLDPPADSGVDSPAAASPLLNELPARGVWSKQSLAALSASCSDSSGTTRPATAALPLLAAAASASTAPSLLGILSSSCSLLLVGDPSVLPLP